MFNETALSKKKIIRGFCPKFYDVFAWNHFDLFIWDNLMQIGNQK